MSRAIKPPNDAVMLLDHGTCDPGITASQIILAAESDLRRRDKNKAIRAERRDVKASLATGNGAEKFLDQVEKLWSYAFAAKHVNKAQTAAQLIQLALDQSHVGEAISDANTKRIYRAKQQLQEALSRLLVPA